MRRQSVVAIPFFLLLLSAPLIGVSAQAPAPITDYSMARPGRDPNQPIDEEYTKKIKEYTCLLYTSDAADE